MKTNSYLFDTDSYKASHYLQYPPKTTSMLSYIESRGSAVYPASVFFGLQYFLKEHLSHHVTPEEVEKAKVFFEAHGEPFNYEGWMYIAKELGGKLPVRIRAVPEGTVLPLSNVLVTVESTDPKVFWIVSWIETMLLRYVWYGTTVATRSWHARKIILNALERSAEAPEMEIDFKLHDFGARGVSSQESAMLGGAAHLVNFKGSDTVIGVLCANEYYNSPMAGFSIPAAEHSSITSWGRENEAEAYRNMLRHFAKKDSLVAVVSDSYDIYNACSKIWGEELRQEVIDSGATVVVRPDSGTPHEVVLKTLQILADKFGYTTNSKGFKVLNNVRVIQGDGITDESIPLILECAMSFGFSASNIAFGMGGGLLQQLNRDTLQFAMKCSHITCDGKSVEVLKKPVTDSKKNSKKGRLDLVKTDEGVKTVMLETDELAKENTLMRTVYENGDILVDDTLDNIRERALNNEHLENARQKGNSH